ncbi:Bacterio-opsin activator, HTH domain protein [mine drainage metagenome]|uniref:Bacterio-opsin activator, HTH domain protein n=1 Tax=mine drainage metagenome TaxID=410659 RepID=T1CUG0_9ZZZZ
MEILDRLEVGKGLTMIEAHVLSKEGGGWSEEVRSLPGVKDVELIDATEGSEVFRVFFRGRTFIPLLKKLRLVRHFPFPIQNGVATWTVVGPEGKVRLLLKQLEGGATGVHVDAVHHGPLPRGTALLTSRQQEVLHRAMAEGYFDVPRRISLTELAPKLGVAISTLSVTLAVIEKKILEPHT